MAPSLLSPQSPSAVPYAQRNVNGSSQSSRNVSGALSVQQHYDRDFSSETVESRQQLLGQRLATRKRSTANLSNISNVVYAIKRRSSDELGSDISARLFGATHESLLEWISAQRMTDLPPEGSSYDKVLAWTQLFANRLHSFNYAIQEFAGDSYLAAQLAYGYCALLLDLGKENASALMMSFGFFYNMSVPLVNLLERTELFSVTQEIREQLVQALSDLVTLVASVATYFHKAIRGVTACVTVNVYSVFKTQIRTFLARCEGTAELMWKHQLLKEGLDATKISLVKAVKTWVGPEDHVLSNVLSSSSNLAHDREELTCLYIGTHLTRFLKGSQKILSLSGAPGAGKTVLASVIVDHLQHPIAGVTYCTLFVPISSRVPVQASPRALVKSLLHQLFQKRTGNVELLNIVAEAYERSLKSTSDEEHDNLLWAALERAVAANLAGAQDIVIVVDGLDECTAGEDAVFKRLQSVANTKGATTLKMIVLGAKPQPGAQNLAINEDLVFDDIMAVVRDSFESFKLYMSMDEMERETLVASITTASKGSFVWAKQASQRLRRETTTKDLFGALEKIEKFSIAEFVHKELAGPDVSEQTRLLLSWLVTAERPLSIKELASLASVHVEKHTVDFQHKIDVVHALKPVSSLVSMQDGLVYLRHNIFRKSVMECMSETKGAVKDRHGDLAVRLLIYINSAVTDSREPTLTGIDKSAVHQLTSKFDLLEFAISYWPLHLRRSFAYLKPDTSDTEAAKLVSKVMPKSLTVYLVQAVLWEHRPLPVQLKYHTMVTNITRQVLTQSSHVTLQSIIFLANIYRQIDYTPDATTLFYESVTICNKLLTHKSTLTRELACIFIDITNTRTATTAAGGKIDVIMTHREQVLLILTECYTVQYGRTSEYVVTTLKLLVEHYRMTKEETKVQQIITTIRSISSTTEFGTGVITGGTTTTGGDDGSQLTGDLNLHLHGRKKEPACGGSRGIVFTWDTDEADEVIEGQGIKFDFEFYITKAERYVAEGHIELAERTYVEIWQRATLEYRATHSATWEERRIRSVVTYCRFLTKHSKRTEHVRSVLSATWGEYKWSSTQQSVVTESTSSLYVEMAAMMKSVGMVTESLTLMKHCSHFYQSTGKTTSSTYKELQHSIQTTSTEIFKSVSSSTTTTVSETMLEEMVLEKCRSVTTIEHSTFTATYSLVKIYIAQHRWHDSMRLLKHILRSVWPSLFSPNVEDVVAPSKHVEDCVELAERLAVCYHARRRRAKEEDIRIRVYRAMRSSRKVDDKLRVKVTEVLILMLRRTPDMHSELLITTKQELLDDTTVHYGGEHPTVIKLLWELAELTRPRPVFIEYYQRIIKAVHCHDKDTITPDVFEPYIIVATEMYSRGQFTESLQYYKIVFATFLRQPKASPKFADQCFVKTLFSRYTHCLRSVRTEFAVLHRVSVEYQTQCKTVFGATASITIQATLHLAKLCQESKRYELEAISLYELLLKIKSDEIDHTEICAILDSIYEEQADLVTTTSSSESHSVSSEHVQRALTVLKKRMTTIRETHGWAHEESLSKLSELVLFYSSQKTSSTEEETVRSQTVLTELKQAMVQILTTETSSTRLLAAASTIASSYVHSHQVSHAIDIKQELYRQVIMKDTAQASSFGFDLTSRGRESLVFIAEFEHSLSHRGHSGVTVTDVLAELTTQYIYFSEFHSLVRVKKTASSSSSSVPFSSVIGSASRLHVLLHSCERHEAAMAVFHELVAYFSAHDGKRIKLARASQMHVLLRTLLEYFGTFRSNNLVRSVGISGTRGVEDLLRERKYDAAIDLATATFAYVSADESYRKDAEITKLVLVLGLTLADGSGARYSDLISSQTQHGHQHTHQQPLARIGSSGGNSSQHSPHSTFVKPVTQTSALTVLTKTVSTTKPDEASRKKLLAASRPITSDALRVLGEMRVSLEHIPLPHLSQLIAVLGAQGDHRTLSDLLTTLWASREAQRAWPPHVHLALGRRYILARCLVGDTTAAVRLAEDIVYNCRRVHGGRHPQTLDMSVFLTQLYTGIAQRYHKKAAADGKDGKPALGGGQHLAARYYKKSAAVHENILRVFSDPAYAELEGGTLEGNHHYLDDVRSNNSGFSGSGGSGGQHNGWNNFAAMHGREGSVFDGHRDDAAAASDGERVRTHFRLLKLAVERLGAWPKDYNEYERLNADVFGEFGESLGGFEGVEKWDLGKFGGGKAESSEDMLDIEGFKHWALFGSAGVEDEEEEE
ncbi:ankyrin repeat domain-containing protein 50 [Microdochium nivale]|nr:ankyrin repeat domain-containing protein 50 [Microdochium nivale]